MEYTIKNEFLSVTAQTFGAELMSIKNLKNNVEYLWQGDEKYWTGRAPNLFPFCGRLTNNQYTYHGKTYFMERHGFARLFEFEFLNKTENSLSFILKSNEQTRKMYPFDFEHTITYVLDKNTLKTVYWAKNVGNETMYCAFGGHPAFNVPINDEGEFEDYYLEFKNGYTPVEMDFKEYLYTGEVIPFEVDKANRHHLKRDFYIHKAHFIIDEGFSCALKSPKSDKSVTLTYPNMKYLGLWHTFELEAPFICIEPWSSIPSYFGKVDDIETKLELFSVEPNKEASLSFDITVE